MNMPIRIALLLLCTAIAGCATMPTPRNAPHSQYQPSQQLTGDQFAQCVEPVLPPTLQGLTRISAQSLTMRPDLLGSGDRLLLTISGDKDVLSGIYVIGSNGHLRIEGGVDVMASGRSRYEVERDVRDQLIQIELIRDIVGNVRLTVAESAGIQLSISGAVFQQGVLRIGERRESSRAATLSNPASGDFNAGRSLAWALRASGGIRPDAEASTIYLIREQQYAVIDVTPAFNGGIPTDPQLASGDRIIVPSSGCFRAQYVRPSSVTAPGIRVFMSNLSRPVTSNSAAGIGKDATRFPYGARFTDGLMSANCVGGSAMTARRKAVLVSRNPINERTVVIQRNVEDLIREADRDEMNPYLMPGDSLACYDGTAMSLVDVITVASKVLGPLALANGLSE